MATIKKLNPDNVAGNARLAKKAVSPIAQSQKVSMTKAAIRANNPAGSSGAAAGMKADLMSGRSRVADPFGVDFGFALPVGKLIKAAQGLRAAGKIAESESLAARVASKSLGGSSKALQATRESKTLFWPAPKDLQYMGRGASGKAVRGLSEGVYPRLSKSTVSDATVNIVDTRRMNPLQARSALENGVVQTTKIARRAISASPKINKVTNALLRGRTAK
jgi:hypothetical protein